MPKKIKLRFKTYEEALDTILKLSEERALLNGIESAGRYNATYEKLLEVAKKMIKEKRQNKKPRVAGKILEEIRAEKEKKELRLENEKHKILQS